MSRCEQSELNYIWVGLPASMNPKVIPGQDIIGPLKMSDVGQASRFFCLGEHAEYYHRVFQDHPNVKVMPIQAYLKQYCKTESGEAKLLVKRTLALLKHFLKKQTTRNVVNAKNLMQFYLLYKQAGYMADTNILAERGSRPDFKIYQTFMLPAFVEKPETTADIDGWLMYSPAPYHHDARLSLLQYLDMHEALIDLTKAAHKQSMRWFPQNKQVAMRTAAESILQELMMITADPEVSCVSDKKILLMFADAKNYHQACGRIFVIAVSKIDEKSTKAFWYAEHSADYSSFSINDLRIEKFLFNTHKYKAVLDQASYFISGHRPDLLGFILSHGQDPNAANHVFTGSRHYKSLPLLHDAIMNRDEECVRQLILHGARVDCKTTILLGYGRRISRTTKQWLKQVDNPAITQLIHQHESKQVRAGRQTSPSVLKQFGPGCLWARPLEEKRVRLMGLRSKMANSPAYSL